MRRHRILDREHFIPLRKPDLVRLMLDDLSEDAGERAKFEKLCRQLEAILNYEYHQRLEELKDAYAPFDPDAVIQLNCSTR